MGSIKRFSTASFSASCSKGCRDRATHVRAQDHCSVSRGKKTPQSFRFRGFACASALSQREERCIACKLCECPAMAIVIESAERDDGSRRMTRYDIDFNKCIFCGFCEEACPVDAIVETRVYEVSRGKARRPLLHQANVVGQWERYEAQIAEDRELDSKYR